MAFGCYAEGFAVGLVGGFELVEDDLATELLDFDVVAVFGNACEFGVGFGPFESVGQANEFEGAAPYQADALSG